MAALGLRCHARAFSSCGKRGLLFVAMRGLLIAVASLVARSTGSGRVGFSSCGSWALEHGLNSCGAWAYLLRGMWALPGPGLEPVSPALAGGFLTTVPSGKPQGIIFLKHSFKKFYQWGKIYDWNNSFFTDVFFFTSYFPYSS